MLNDIMDLIFATIVNCFDGTFIDKFNQRFMEN